jgi:tRNA(Ile)-lysidine synthase
MKWSALAEKVHQSLTRNALLNKEDKILIALSGGMDSVVLLHVLLELRPYWRWELVIGHVDHGLRPGEDEKESKLCSKLAQETGLPYLETRLSINSDQSSYLHGTQKPSPESLAREKRYEAFAAWADDLECQAVCTAHHKSDQAETVLYRMLTGSGMKGLRGIPASRERYKRPLLDISKDEIRAYAEEKKLTYYNDSSNRNNVFVRNKIRNKLIPFLKENGFDNAEDHLASTAKSIEEAYQAIEILGNKAAVKSYRIRKGRPELDIKIFEDFPVFIKKYVLRKICKEQLKLIGHISDKQMDQLIFFISTAETGAIMSFWGKQILKDRKYIIWQNDDFLVSTKKALFEPSTVSWEKGCFEVTIKKKEINENMTFNDHLVAYFSYAIKGAEMHLRKWAPGDNMTLFSSGKTKKVSDILKDEKVSALAKIDHPVMLKDNEIIWVPGVKRSNLYKVKPEDKKYIQITYINTENNNDQKNLNA